MTNKSGEKGAKACQECSAVLGPRKSKFCSPACRQLAADKKKATRKPCIRCGGDKGYGHRGSRYCADCRLAMGPVWQQMERERGQMRVPRIPRTGSRPKKVRPGDGYMWCGRCSQYLSPPNFPGRSGTKKPPYCRVCQKQYYHQAMLKKRGIDSAEYHRIYEIQEGRCAICKNRPRSYRLAVDHDHKDGKIRGLLCKRCNHDLLGSAYDSIELLERAISYLEAPPAQTGVRVLIHDEMKFNAGLRGEPNDGVTP